MTVVAGGLLLGVVIVSTLLSNEVSARLVEHSINIFTMCMAVLLLFVLFEQ